MSLCSTTKCNNFVTVSKCQITFARHAFIAGSDELPKHKGEIEESNDLFTKSFFEETLARDQEVASGY
jgi:hypothetical protein